MGQPLPPITPPAPPTGEPSTTPTTTPTTTPPATGQPGTPAAGDEPLGPAGKKALDEERAARKALEQQLAKLSPLAKLAEVIGKPSDGKPTDDPVKALTERLGQHEKDLAAEREARWRAEVAHEKNLTPAQAARLAGKSRDELAADAAALLAAFAPTGGAQPGQQPATPRPDPSQGPRGAARKRAGSLEDAVADQFRAV
jgi:hypothetical protein